MSRRRYATCGADHFSIYVNADDIHLVDRSLIDAAEEAAAEQEQEEESGEYIVG